MGNLIKLIEMLKEADDANDVVVQVENLITQLTQANARIKELEKVISFYSAADPYQSCTEETILAAVAYARALKAHKETSS